MPLGIIREKLRLLLKPLIVIVLGCTGGFQGIHNLVPRDAESRQALGTGVRLIIEEIPPRWEFSMGWS